ncbi:MAG: hypothetical protein GVY18_02465 [Bacteroidetes bacterium]|jgi:hypothetical protein|nr:hypothetical protein [Bacteroidota bacterium]
MTCLRSLLVIALLVLGGLARPAQAQMPRERANPGGPVEDTFWAPTLIMTSSVMHLPQQNLNFTIMHSFGIATDGVETLFGLDGSANIRFGLDYGVTDWLSLGIGRSRFDKLYDGRVKARLLQQRKDNRIPVTLSLKGDVGIVTTENGFDVQDRLNYLGAVLIARKFNDRLSLQVTPMFSHFNTVFISRDLDGEIITEENDHLAVGLGGRYAFNDRWAILAEYIPVFGDRTDGTENAVAVGVNIETGGHVFQLFLTTSQWMTEQHTIARNTDDFFAGDFRFGFNVNRVFRLGGY